MKPLKVIQWYTGDIACHQIRLIHASPSLELIGALVYHEEKAGLDVGEIAGIGPIGVITTRDPDEMLALDADCVLYNPPTERYDEIIPMLASGKNVISIMAGWNPKKMRCWPDIQRACETGNSSLYGTGLNPGLSYELALLASSCCSEVESIHIRTCEQQSTLSEVFLRAFGFGRTEQEFASGDGASYAIFHNLLDITDLIAEKLALPHDGRAFDTCFEPAVKEYDDKILIRKGTMAGLLVKASTTYHDKPVVTIELRFLLDDDYVSEDFLAGRPRHGWIEVDVKGTPGSRIMHELYMDETVIGTWSTGTRAVYAIPAVCAASSGLLSPLDLPLAHRPPAVAPGATAD